MNANYWLPLGRFCIEIVEAEKIYCKNTIKGLFLNNVNFLWNSFKSSRKISQPPRVTEVSENLNYPFIGLSCGCRIEVVGLLLLCAAHRKELHIKIRSGTMETPPGNLNNYLILHAVWLRHSQVLISLKSFSRSTLDDYTVNWGQLVTWCHRQHPFDYFFKSSK